MFHGFRSGPKLKSVTPIWVLEVDFSSLRAAMWFHAVPLLFACGSLSVEAKATPLAAALLRLPFVIRPSCLHQSLYLVGGEPGGEGVLEKCAERRRERKNADESTDRQSRHLDNMSDRWFAQTASDGEQVNESHWHSAALLLLQTINQPDAPCCPTVIRNTELTTDTACPNPQLTTLQIL